MKLLRSTAVAAASASFVLCAHAQSVVTLYGTLDNGLAYVHNAGGKSTLVKMNAGGMSGNSWGMTGREDLGAGLSTIFKAESNFSPNDGSLGNNGRMFGAKVYVGLASSSWGAITLGRQNDPVANLVSPLTADAYFGTFATPGDVDSYDGSMNFDNAIKWSSPNWNGFNAQIMYSVGGIAGASGSGQSWVGALVYASGPISLGTGIIHVDRGNTIYSTRGTSTADSIFNSAVNSAYASARSLNIARVDGKYAFGPFTVGTALSYSQYTPDASSTYSKAEKYMNGAVFGTWQFGPAFYTVLGYNYTKSTGDSSAKYSQFNLGIDYLLSKRTDVYATTGYQHASGQNGLGAAQAVIGSYSVNSGSSSQFLVLAGIRHRF